MYIEIGKGNRFEINVALEYLIIITTLKENRCKETDETKTKKKKTTTAKIKNKKPNTQKPNANF